MTVVSNRFSKPFLPDRRLGIVRAISSEQLKAVHELRGLVFSEEHSWEPMTGSGEFDEFDEYSIQSMVNAKRLPLTASTDTSVEGEDVPVASARLILGDKLREAQKDFPFMKHCTISHFPFGFKGTAEISRFCISQIRKSALGLSNTRDCFQIIAFNLKAVLQMSAEAKITVWGMFMDTTLEAWIGRMGGHFHHLGIPVEWPEKSECFRRSCWVNVHDFSVKMREERPELWSFLTDDGELMERISK